MSRVINGECLEVMDKLIAEGVKVDAVICDPPYGTTSCKWDSIIPFEAMWERLDKLTKDNGAVVLFGSEPFTSFLVCSNPKHFREKLTWEKHRAPNIGCAKYMHMKYSEDIVVFARKKCTYNPQMQPRESTRVKEAQKGNSKNWFSARKDENVHFCTQYEPQSWQKYDANLKYPSCILKFPAVVSNSKEKTSHPTQKPVKLMEYLVKTYTNEGDTVLDFTCGSGSTCVACINTNRDFIGIELDKKYYDITVNRCKEAKEGKNE